MQFTVISVNKDGQKQPVIDSNNSVAAAATSKNELNMTSKDLEIINSRNFAINEVISSPVQNEKSCFNNNNLKILVSTPSWEKTNTMSLNNTTKEASFAKNRNVLRGKKLNKMAALVK